MTRPFWFCRTFQKQSGSLNGGLSSTIDIAWEKIGMVKGDEGSGIVLELGISVGAWGVKAAGGTSCGVFRRRLLKSGMGFWE